MTSAIPSDDPSPKSLGVLVFLIGCATLWFCVGCTIFHSPGVLFRANFYATSVSNLGEFGRRHSSDDPHYWSDVVGPKGLNVSKSLIALIVLTRMFSDSRHSSDIFLTNQSSSCFKVNIEAKAFSKGPEVPLAVG